MSSIVTAWCLTSGLFLIALARVLVTMSSSLGCLEHDQPEIRDFECGLVAMWEMILAMLSQDDYNQMHN